MPLAAITADDVDGWHHRLGTGDADAEGHAYGLLRTILGGALQHRLIDFNPWHIRGAGNAKRVKKIKPLSLLELERSSQRCRSNIGCSCCSRRGVRSVSVSSPELRRKDIDLKNGVIHVRRAVVRVDGATLVGEPKSDAGCATSRSRRICCLHQGASARTHPVGAATGCCSPARTDSILHRRRCTARRRRRREPATASITRAASPDATISDSTISDTQAQCSPPRRARRSRS